MNENSTIENLNQFEHINILELNEVEQNYMVSLVWRFSRNDTIQVSACRVQKTPGNIYNSY